MKTKKLSYEFLKSLYPQRDTSNENSDEGSATHNHSKKTLKIRRVMARNSRRINRK